MEKAGNITSLRKVDGLWVLPEEKQTWKLVSLRMEIGGKADAKVWHQRLGHIGDSKLKQMIKDGIIPREADGYTAKSCEICQLTHPKRRHIPGTAERSEMTTVQVDYMPIGHEEKGWKGEVGAYIYSSRCSKLIKTYPVTDATAGSAAITLNKYFKDIAPMLGEKIDCVQTDTGTQFKSKEWNTTCVENKVLHRTCPTDCQAMNGQVERAIGILTAKMKSLLMNYAMNKKFWPLALEAATYLLNRTPHETLGGLTPLGKSTGQRPDLSRTRIFGCTAYVQIPKALRRGKLSDVAWTGAMVGYSTQSPEWIILDPKSGRLRTAYSVTFDESKPGLVTKDHKEAEHTVNEFEISELKPTDKNTNMRSTGSKSDKHGNENVQRITQLNTNNVCNSQRIDPSKFLKNWIHGEYDTVSDETAKIGDTNENENGINSNTETENIEKIDDNSNILTENDEVNSTWPGACMALTSNNINLPSSWKQAINIAEWECAMEKEIEELKIKNAWELVPRQNNAKILPGVWNFRIKKDQNGNVIKYKARWCVDGSKEGFTHPPENVFSPVAELSTVRTFITIAAKEEQVILQADFPNAYVNAEIKEDIYVCQPKGLEEKDKDKYICKLRKALYGCPVSGKRWNETLTKAILLLGYKQSFIDHCLFYREKDDIKDLMLIYVDVLVTSNKGEYRADYLLDELSEVFEIKKLRRAQHILGLGIVVAVDPHNS